MYQVPSEVDTLVKTNPVSLLLTVTFAPGTTDPVVSVMAPIIVAVPVDDWAKRLAANRAEAKVRRKYIRGLLRRNTIHEVGWLSTARSADVRRLTCPQL